MKLTKVTLHKYKSFLTEQMVLIEENVTRIVGKNESGKTAFLEALSKFNYFDDVDKSFVFDKTHDYPRNELKDYAKAYPENDFEVITCDFEISESLRKQISESVGPEVFEQSSISISKSYNGTKTYKNISCNVYQFIKNFLKKYTISTEDLTSLQKSTSLKALYDALLLNAEYNGSATELKKIYIDNGFSEWSNDLSAFIAKTFIAPNIPVFWYFDEYYTIPPQISLTRYVNKSFDVTLTKEQYDISSALFELAGIDTKKLLSDDDHESYIAELEATSNSITDKFLEYWSTNNNLEIQFEVQTISGDKLLNIRIRNIKHRVTLPLKNRSKGFTWFFSFLVWFSKIQDKKNVIVLLDEPGLNLHAEAQADLLRYIDEAISPKYQTIYTTHSPFMIEPSKLSQVRTVYDSGDSKVGSIISDALEEKDKSTLFPLQAALGYDIAQNLYISSNNLLVEGVADLVYLTVISEKLKELDKNYLDESITIIPVGGLDKVATFISLLRGNKLKVACFLDTFTDQKGKSRMTDLFREKIIKENNVRFVDEFNTNLTSAEFEDLFSADEYISLFNKSFSEFADIDTTKINDEISIIPNINKLIGKSRFNHYTPANYLSKHTEILDSLSEQTIERFDNIFKTINKLFK